MSKNTASHVGFGILTFGFLAVTPVFAAFGGFEAPYAHNRAIIAVFAGGYGLLAVMVTMLWVAWAHEQGESVRTKILVANLTAQQLASPAKSDDMTNYVPSGQGPYRPGAAGGVGRVRAAGPVG